MILNIITGTVDNEDIIPADVIRIHYLWLLSVIFIAWIVPGLHLLTSSILNKAPANQSPECGGHAQSRCEVTEAVVRLETKIKTGD